jgi:hypothetical protein
VTEFKVLGYQLRSDIALIEALGLNERNRFLLNPQVITQLSVDRAVWADVKNASVAKLLFEDFEDQPSAKPNGLELYQLRGGDVDIDGALQGFSGCLVELSVLEQDVERLIETHAILLSNAPKRNNGWDLMGIDVCDDWHHSALANIDIGERWEMVRDVYSNDTNSFGLFTEIARSRSYAERFGRLVPEHAPFVPWRVRRYEPS